MADKHGPPEYVDVPVETIEAESAKAYLFKLATGEKSWWPKSQVRPGFACKKGDVQITVPVTKWIRDQKIL